MNRLTVKQVNSDLPDGRYNDGAGLSLVVKNNGAAKSWVFRSRYVEPIDGASKERLLGLGSLRDVSLSEARAKAAELRDKKVRGGDVMMVRDNIKVEAFKRSVGVGNGPTFRDVAEDYMASRLPFLKSAKHAAQWRSTLENYVFPVIGDMPVADVKPEDVLRCVSALWTRANETGSRVLQRIRLVMYRAESLDMLTRRNPADASIMARLLVPRSMVRTTKHHTALPYQDMPRLYETLKRELTVSPLALRFLMLTGLRTSEVLNMRFGWIDFDAATLTVPKAFMKAKREHKVPLSGEALAVVAETAKFRAPHFRPRNTDFVFPGDIAEKGLSNMTMLQLLRRLDVDAVPHGMRSSFADWAAETTNYPTAVVEAALAHVVEDKTQAAYRRTDFFARRVALMNDWGGFVSSPAEPLAIPPRRSKRPARGLGRRAIAAKKAEHKTAARV